MEIVVGYLHRHTNPPELLKRFLDSYRTHNAGIEHRLVLIGKGGGLQHPDFPVFECSDAGFDIHAYFKLATAIPADAYVFLNSYSSILADNWCLNLTAPLARHGMTGCTGSWERLYPQQSFPNPHIRTTGFALRADLIPRIRWPASLEKIACNEFEAGDFSLTKQVMAMGCDPVVVDVLGENFRVPEWEASNTFRMSEQEHLLISDNRTDHYASAEENERAYLRQLAWGDSA